MGSFARKPGKWLAAQGGFVGKSLNKVIDADPTARLIMGKSMDPGEQFKRHFDAFGHLGINPDKKGSALPPLTSSLQSQQKAGAASAAPATASSSEPGIKAAGNYQQHGAAGPSDRISADPKDAVYTGPTSGQEYADYLNDQYTGQGALETLRKARSNETNTLISKAMDQTNGINALENAALRQNMMAAINSENQSAMRALSGNLASSGLRGGAAVAAKASQRGKATAQVAEAERGLISDNIGYKQEALKNASGIVFNQEQSERDQAADRLNTVLNIRNQDMNLEGARLQAEAARQSGGGGKK